MCSIFCRCLFLFCFWSYFFLSFYLFRGPFSPPFSVFLSPLHMLQGCTLSARLSKRQLFMLLPCFPHVHLAPSHRAIHPFPSALYSLSTPFGVLWNALVFHHSNPTHSIVLCLDAHPSSLCWQGYCTFSSLILCLPYFFFLAFLFCFCFPSPMRAANMARSVFVCYRPLPLIAVSFNLP